MCAPRWVSTLLFTAPSLVCRDHEERISLALSPCILSGANGPTVCCTDATSSACTFISPHGNPEAFAVSDYGPSTSSDTVTIDSTIAYSNAIPDVSPDVETFGTSNISSE